MTTHRRKPGRPPGPSFKAEAAALPVIADIKLATPERKVSDIIREIGFTDEYAANRLTWNFRNHRAELMMQARQRAAARARSTPPDRKPDAAVHQSIKSLLSQEQMVRLMRQHDRNRPIYEAMSRQAESMKAFARLLDDKKYNEIAKAISKMDALTSPHLRRMLGLPEK